MNAAISPAGWPLRHFALDELLELLGPCSPQAIEISKEFFRTDISLKALAKVCERLHELSGPIFAYAGTTDLVSCSGFPWARYRDYLAVQVAQAQFLGCSLFRLFVGKPVADFSIGDLVQRIQVFCADIAPMQACIEIDRGAETDLNVLAEILRCTPAKIVVDFGNLHDAGLSSDDLLRIIPTERVAYFHQRNLPPVWVEHRPSLADERRWSSFFPDGIFLWEPKTIDDPRRVQELFRDYRASH